MQLHTCNLSGAQSWASQQLTWTAQGKVASVTAPSGATAQTTSYVYDADGNEIAEAGASGTTLFLPGEQLTLSGTTTTGMRYYAFAGQLVAEGSATSLYWAESNLQGTLQAAVNTASESVVVRRTVAPYGQVLAGAGTWPDNRGFLNDPSTAASLVDIGARKYSPATGAFISVDPQLDASDPQSMTGYVYAAGDPVNSSDPTGLCIKGLPGDPPTTCTGQQMPVYQPPPPCWFFCGWTGPGPYVTSGGGGGNAGEQPAPAPPPPTPGEPPVQPAQPLPVNSTPIPSDPATGIGALGVLGGVAGFFGGGLALLGSIATGGAATTGPLLGSGAAYSVAYEMKLSDTMHPGLKRRAHFQAANAALWHTAAGVLQDLFHPGDIGGMGIWG